MANNPEIAPKEGEAGQWRVRLDFLPQEGRSQDTRQKERARRLLSCKVWRCWLRGIPSGGVRLGHTFRNRAVPSQAPREVPTRMRGRG